jgi:integrase
MQIKDLELKNFKPKAKPYYITQKSTHGGNGSLWFKVLPSGAIDAFFVYFPTSDKRKMKKIARYGKGLGEMSLQSIRNEYSKLSVEYQDGIDVKDEAQRRIAAEKLQQQAIAEAELKKQMQGSFKQLTNLYLQDLEASKSRHYYLAVKQAFSNIEGVDPLKKAADITKADILAILHPIMARGSLVMANRMYAYLSAMFKWGIEFDDTHHADQQGVKFYIEKNPVTDVKKPHKTETPTDRFLTESEVRELLYALGKSGIAPHRANVLKLMLFTGARLEAISTLRWQDVDLDNRLITIQPDHSKNGLTWVIPLGSLAYNVLETTPRLHDTFIFPADNGLEAIRTDYFSKAVTRLCDKFGIEQFTPKDLRRTFKTLAGKAGIAKDIRDKIQNHALTDVSAKHYDRYEYLPEKQAAIQIWDDWLKEVLNNVVSIAKRQ